jgi:hypothetical protein
MPDARAAEVAGYKTQNKTCVFCKKHMYYCLKENQEKEIAKCRHFGSASTS